MSNNQFEHIDPQSLFDMGDNDPEFVTDIVQDVLEAVPKSIEELTTAAENDKQEDVIFLAHKLKGTLRFVGCMDVAALLERIEKDKPPMNEVLAMMEQVKQKYSLAEKEFEELLDSLK